MKHHEGMVDTPTRQIVEGDVFSTKDVDKLMRAIEAEGVDASCVFFRPLLGLVGSGNRPVTYRRLYELLKKSYDHLVQDGDMYIQEDREFGESMRILSIALNRSSEIPFCISNGGALHIVRSEKAPRELPRFTELQFSEQELSNFEKAFEDQRRKDARNDVVRM